MSLHSKLSLKQGKKAYFASDFHLGVPDYGQSRQREAEIIDWLNQIESDAQYVFLMGDLFDFWFEYKQVVPKGFVRFLGKIAQLSDQGIEVFFFAGNHDMWVKDYFQKELGMKVLFDPISIEIYGKKLHIGHGDGLGPGDRLYKIIKVFFRSRFCRMLFGALHPAWGIGLAHYFSLRSKRSHLKKLDSFAFKSKESEWLWCYCSQIQTQTHHDFYIFGHRHLSLDLQVGQTSRYLNCGEWFKAKTFVEFDGWQASLKHYRPEQQVL
jgi:UDP-2,3-diacylglucosamine hydrolase